MMRDVKGPSVVGADLEGARHCEVISSVTCPLLVHLEEAFLYGSIDVDFHRSSGMVHDLFQGLSVVESGTFVLVGISLRHTDVAI